MHQCDQSPQPVPPAQRVAIWEFMQMLTASQLKSPMILTTVGFQRI